MAEWSKATVSKIVVRFYCTEGSNPSLSAIFVFPSRFFKSESVCALTAKTRWHKAFYKTYRRVFETHSDFKIRPFFRKNPPFSVWILTIPEALQKQESIQNSLIININDFFYWTYLGGRIKLGWKEIRTHGTIDKFLRWAYWTCLFKNQRVRLKTRSSFLLPPTV